MQSGYKGDGVNQLFMKTIRLSMLLVIKSISENNNEAIFALVKISFSCSCGLRVVVVCLGRVS